MTRSRWTMAIVALAMVATLTPLGLARSEQPAGAAPATHYIQQNNGYVAASNIFGSEVIDYYWEETRHAIYGSVQNFDYWADYIVITDHAVRQSIATQSDLPGLYPITWSQICHPATGQCLYNVAWTQEQVFFHGYWGWFGTCPIMRILRHPNNTHQWTMYFHNC